MNNIECRLLERKSDLEDIVQECSAYLKTKQFMADRIFQQQEEIQILKQQIFSLSSTNSQLSKIIDNFERDICLLKDKLPKPESKKKHYSKFNLSNSENEFAKSEDLVSHTIDENKDGSFSDLEMNYNLIDNSQNSENIRLNEKNNVNDLKENGIKNKDNATTSSPDEVNNDEKISNDQDNFVIYDTKETSNYKDYKKLNANNKKEIIKENAGKKCANNDNIRINNKNNNCVSTVHHGKENEISYEELEKLKLEIFEKTIENNKLRTDKFIIMSELNEILTSLVRIDLDKLNDFYLNNISKNNLSKYLMPSAKGIKYNILSCQNQMTKIIKSDYGNNSTKNEYCSFDNIPKFNSSKNSNDPLKEYKLSPIMSNKRSSKYKYYEDDHIGNINLNTIKNFKQIEKESFKYSSLEKNFNVNVKALLDLFSKHEGEFDALLEKKLMKLNRGNNVNNVKDNQNNNLRSSNPCKY